jgi:hypothetical protein
MARSIALAPMFRQHRFYVRVRPRHPDERWGSLTQVPEEAWKPVNLSAVRSTPEGLELARGRAVGQRWSSALPLEGGVVQVWLMARGDPPVFQCTTLSYKETTSLPFQLDAQVSGVALDRILLKDVCYLGTGEVPFEELPELLRAEVSRLTQKLPDKIGKYAVHLRNLHDDRSGPVSDEIPLAISTHPGGSCVELDVASVRPGPGAEDHWEPDGRVSFMGPTLPRALRFALNYITRELDRQILDIEERHETVILEAQAPDREADIFASLHGKTFTNKELHAAIANLGLTHGNQIASDVTGSDLIDLLRKRGWLFPAVDDKVQVFIPSVAARQQK